MSQTVADQAQRNQALDIRQSFIVQAPAGSGKTELISQRFLALLERCEQPESILAITFTRKAAAEMRLRIIKALESASKPMPEASYQQKTWQLACAAMRQDQQKNWQLLANTARLKVVTIDSLNASLTRQMPLLSKMGTSVAPVDQPGALYLEAARRTLQELETPLWKDDLSLLMLHLGNNIDRIQQLLVNMLQRRDQWLKHLMQSSDSQQRRSQLEQSLQNYITDHLQTLKTGMPAGMLESLCELADFACHNLEPGKPSIIASWQHDHTLSTAWDCLDQWQILAELLLTGTNEPRKSINKNLGFPAPGSEKKDVERKALLQHKKQQLLDLIAEVSLSPALLEGFAGLRAMPAPGYTDFQWQLLEALSRLLLQSAAHLKVVFAEQGKVDFSEISLSALEALGASESPTEMAMMLDYQLQHILVDEFQDTSQGQMQLLKKLTAGWQPDDGRTLFLVGDPMQSIYRFREAEVGLYLKAREKGIGQIRLHNLRLEVNFRSQQGIVEWVNSHLQQAFASRINISTGAVTYAPSTPSHPLLPGDAVNIYASIENDSQQEAMDIADIVQKNLNSDEDSTTAILVRSRSHLLHIVETLKARKLPFQAIELDPLRDQPCVIDINSLMLAMTHAADRLHWLSILRAPWCGLTLPDLLIISGDDQSAIYDNCVDESIVQALSEDGQLRLRKLLSIIQPFLNKAGNLKLSDLLENIWIQLGGPQIYFRETDHQAIASYLTLVTRHESGGIIEDLALFNEALDKLYAPSDSKAGRVQIMTIHKSKGLEFEHVILPGLGRRGKNDESHLLEWLERTSQTGETELMMAPIKASEDASGDAISKSLQAINREKSRHELTRLLYVALTRSKQRLYLFAHASTDKKGNPQPASNSLLAILWPEIAALFENIDPPKKQATSQLEGNAQKQLSRTPANWVPDLPEALPIPGDRHQIHQETRESSLEFDWAGETARAVGILTHRFLERIANANAQNDISLPPPLQADVINGLCNLGIAAEESLKASDKVLIALKNTLDDERGKWILKNHAEASTEYSLTCKTDSGFRRFVIDRTFIDEQDTRWIIDYKTGSHEGSDKNAFLDQEQQRYQAQLESYAQLLSQMEDRPVKLGLYFPLLKGWREWQYEAGN